MGVYPGAWMTVAQCARYVDLLGIPSFKESALVLGGAVSCSSRKGGWSDQGLLIPLIGNLDGGGGEEEGLVGGLYPGSGDMLGEQEAVYDA
jgi:hypothetical protein